MTNGSGAKLAYRVRNLVARTAGPLGLFAALRLVTRGEPRILMYHRFAEQPEWNKVSVENFRAQIRYLNERFELITARELGDQIDNGRIRPRQALITVDDGYRDFYELALPVLREECVPATFFVTSKFVSGEIWLWPDKLEYILSQGDLSSAEQRAAWNQEVDILLNMTPPARENYLAEYAERRKISVPDTPIENYLACSWNQLQEINQAGIEIGAHTRRHPRLTNLEARDLEDEIAGSKSDIERHIGVPVVSFCYPNGAPADYNLRVAEVVRASGFKTAVAAHHDGQRGDRYTLRRFGAGNSQFEFEKTVSGSRLI